MRIAYGVHGYGRGHAIRVRALLPALAARHDVHLFAGGHAHEALERPWAPLRIPHLEYVYRRARISWPATVARNAGLLLDLAMDGPVFRIVKGRLATLAPDLVVSDSEPILLRAARALGIPVVSLDHVGVIAHCRVEAPWRDRPQLFRDRLAYHLLLGGADRVIVSSFYRPADVPAHVEIVPPVLRERVRRAEPTAGRHLLVYFNAVRWLTPQVRAALARLGRPVVVYGSDQVGRDGDADHRPFDEAAFVDDLASCRAVLATGGHQLLSEAIHLGKPALLCPEATAEQRLNVREAVRLGMARAVCHRDLTVEGLRAALASLDARPAPAAPPRADGAEAAVAALERAAAELVASPRRFRGEGARGQAT